MNGKWVSLCVLVALAVALLNVVSCGRSQQLVSIQIQPTTENFGSSTTPVPEDAGLNVQLQAVGTYIHPPVTKDITSQVKWSSNTPQMVTVNSTGLIAATGDACGNTLVSAAFDTNQSSGGISSSGAVVIGYMTANVICYTGSGGGGTANPAITITFLGNGSGTVTSTPPGLSCASPDACVNQSFTAGSPVTLTATPNSGSTFGGWTNCPVATSTSACAFNVANDVTMSVAFN